MLKVYAGDRAEANMLYYGTADTKKVKRIERKAFGVDAVYKAYVLGEWHAMNGHAKRNPFPPGFRHGAFELGYERATW